MDQVRRISAIISFCLMTVLLSGCSVGGDPEPPEYEYRIVKFKDEAFSKYVLAMYENGKYHIFTPFGAAIDDIDYLNVYEQLHKSLYTGKECSIRISERCVVTNVKWEDFSPQEHGYFFTEEEIVDKQPFAVFYRVPEHVVDGCDCCWRKPVGEVRDQLNAMIDDGSIEQYRVDLGY